MTTQNGLTTQHQETWTALMTIKQTINGPYIIKEHRTQHTTPRNMGHIDEKKWAINHKRASNTRNYTKNRGPH